MSVGKINQSMGFDPLFLKLVLILSFLDRVFVIDI